MALTPGPSPKQTSLSRCEVQRDVHGGGRVGESADAEDLDAGRGDGGEAVFGQAALASVMARLPINSTAWRMVARSMLSSRMMSAPAVRACSTWGSEEASTSILTVCGARALAPATAAAMLPAARMWLSLIRIVS